MEQTIDQESIWLSKSDLEELTGYKKKSLQIEFLRDRGIAFIVNGAGRPIVAKTAWTGQPAPQINKKWQPNFAG